MLQREIKLKINNTAIKKVQKVKYLGLSISQNFQFNDYVKNIVKANAAQAMLKNIFNNKYTCKRVKLLCYKQLIRTILTYACPCWTLVNLISLFQMELLRRCEKKMLRKCCGMYKRNDGTTTLKLKH